MFGKKYKVKVSVYTTTCCHVDYKENQFIKNRDNEYCDYVYCSGCGDKVEKYTCCQRYRYI